MAILDCTHVKNCWRGVYTWRMLFEILQETNNHILSKLNHYGVRGVVQNWLANYLSNRQQFVQIKEHKSTTQQITCGVPQGSILGPILYLIYVNDIHNSCNKAHVVSFADDTTVYSSNHNIDVLYNDANAHINGLYQWFYQYMSVLPDLSKICQKWIKIDTNSVSWMNHKRKTH